VDPNLPMHAHYVFDTNVIILTLFPGIQENIVRTAVIAIIKWELV
jgi:L-asparaginase